MGTIFMKCPNRGHENREGAEFCGRCGQPLRLELVCPQCSHTNPPDNSFCDKCGHSLAEPAPAPTPRSPEPALFVSNRYQVKESLGEGGMKNVYLVRDTQLGRDVAFALIKTEQLDDQANEDISQSKDTEGRLFIQEGIKKAKAAGTGVDFIVYPWQNPGEDKPRMKAAGLAYVEDWDSVIWATAYYDDIGSANRTMGFIIIVLSSLLVVGLLSYGVMSYRLFRH